MEPSRRVDLCWLAFFTRVMCGILFAMAGYNKVFVMTASGHAKTFFLDRYSDTWIPSALLWLFGFSIPFIELVGGALLIIGLFRRQTAIAMGFLLLVVTYGHALKEPFFDITTHIIPRSLLILPALMLGPDDDRWSVDYWMKRRLRPGD